MINLLGKVLPSIPRRVFGETWTARDSSRRWAKVALSGNGQYQLAYTDTIGAGSNQLYVSADYGTTWTAKESPRVWSDIKLSFDGQVQVALHNDATVGQIYVSTNFGNTWAAKGPQYDWKFVSLSLNGQIMTALSNGQMRLSSDFGDTWTSPSNTPWVSLGAGNFKGIGLSASGVNQTASAGNYVFVSTDTGVTWTNPLFRWNSSHPILSTNGQIQMLFGADTQFRVGTQINVSTDYGTNWSTKEYVTFRDWRKLAISGDGTRAAGIVGGNQIFVSSDTGNTWTSKFTAPTGITLFLLEMSLDGKTLIANNYISTDYGNNWKFTQIPLMTDIKLANDGTHATATVTTGNIHTTERTRLI